VLFPPLKNAFDSFNNHVKTTKDEQLLFDKLFFVGSPVFVTISKIFNHPLFGSKFIFNSINVANDDSFLKA
jgi:hypothetical protein